MNIFTKTKPFNCDTYTPIGIYLGLRDFYRLPALLESNSYHDRSNSKSFIGLNPLIEIILNDGVLTLKENGETHSSKTIEKTALIQILKENFAQFNFVNPHFTNGFFSYTSFELSHYLEKKVSTPPKNEALPDAHFILYQYVVVLDHFNDKGIITENALNEGDFTENFDGILKKINFRSYPNAPFQKVDAETCSNTPEEFLAHVKQGINHCIRGDVFQLVLSRRFKQRFIGEDFEVYRALRRTNPSPYLFYFDFEKFRLFGSSPEAQLIVSNGNAEIHPIAGTVKKTDVQAEDEAKTEFLKADEKENAEHMMLVDLARNDLSKHCEQVTIERLREVQYFSHVIHLVSKVIGKIDPKNSLDLYLDTFPAGTLSGTPKPKALELIATYEQEARGFYGGGIGFIGANGNLNMAIIIRSVLSVNNCLYYQAGAGIVLDSLPESELQEVDNKLNAIRTAIHNCENETVSLTH